MPVSGRSRVRAYVGLGGNVGPVEERLVAALEAFASLPGVRLRGVSRLYRTRPVGVVDQPAFLNAVAALDVPAGQDPASGALAFLMTLKELERALGRRPGPRWGPRAVDLDLLLFGRHRLQVERPPAARSADPTRPPQLVVPHPQAQQRLFVLAPWADLAPRLVPPGWGETVATARHRRELVEGVDAVVPVGRWDPEVGRWRSFNGGRGGGDAA